MSYMVAGRLHALGLEAERVVEEREAHAKKWETKCREHSLLRQKICEALGIPYYTPDEELLRVATNRARDQETRLATVTRLFNLCEITYGEAAILLGTSRAEFIDAMHAQGVSVVQIEPEEVET